MSELPTIICEHGVFKQHECPKCPPAPGFEDGSFRWRTKTTADILRDMQVLAGAEMRWVEVSGTMDIEIGDIVSLEPGGSKEAPPK